MDSVLVHQHQITLIIDLMESLDERDSTSSVKGQGLNYYNAFIHFKF